MADERWYHLLIDGDSACCEKQPLAHVVDVYANEEGENKHDNHGPEAAAAGTGQAELE